MTSDELYDDFIAELRAFANTWHANEFSSVMDLWASIRIVMTKFALYEVAVGNRKEMPNPVINWKSYSQKRG